ncbi:MAG: hypothetical protein ACRC0L_05590 [Angustibacter sp.]
MATVLDPLRQRLGDSAPSLSDLVVAGARAMLAELEARDRARGRALGTFVARLSAGPPPDVEEVTAIRRAGRR